MAERPYKCPVCHGPFRTESGMMSHLSRQHETPQAMEALGKTFEEKRAEDRRGKAESEQEASELKVKLDDMTKKFMLVTADLPGLYEENATLRLQVQNLTKDFNKLFLAFLGREKILRERFGVDLPNPFGESEDNQPSSGANETKDK